MSVPLRLSAHRGPDGTPVLTVAGEIDLGNIDAFRTALAQAAGEGGRLVVDLTEVGYLDSAALAALFAHARHIEVIAPPLLRSVLTISGLADVTTVTVR